MERLNTTLIAVLILFCLPALSSAVDTAPRITDREIVERLTRVEERLIRVEEQLTGLEEGFKEGQKAILREMDKRFEAMDGKIDLLASIFTAIVVCVIGFAIWDRRTMIRPFETKVKSIEGEILETRGRQQGLIEAFQILGRRDEQVAEILRRFHLM